MKKKWMNGYYQHIIFIQYIKNYPGKLLEYPALRFAHWLLKKRHKFLLHTYTKWAFYKRQKECWKNENTGKRKFKYIIPL